MKKYSLILVCVFAFLGVRSQTFHAGYIIDNDSDTLKGQVANYTEEDWYTTVVFKNSAGESKVYKPNEIKGYGAYDHHYVSVPIPARRPDHFDYYFAETIVSGRISLYKTMVRVSKLTPPFESYLIRKGNSVNYFPAGTMKNIAPMIKDYTALYTQVLSGDFGDDEKSKVIVCKKYNDWYSKKGK